MAGELGKASLDLTANTELFRKNVAEAKGTTGELEHALDALVAIADVSEKALGRVRMSPVQGAESRGAAEAIIAGVRGISDESIAAARELDRVRITDTQAAESGIAGEAIKRNINDIGDEADRTKRKLEEVKLAGGRTGVGVGPFGSGFGRVGVLGTAVGAGVLTSPVLGSAALGALAAIPVLAGAGVGSLGTLALAFDGVGKAIGGDKKAFDALEPSQQQFVQTIRSMDGWLDQLKQKAAAGIFPGLEKGLTAALSPGTLHAISVAIDEFSHSIGSAGEQWGRYFGSAEFQQTFGPLMKEGAHDVTLMSDATLKLFDAVGQLAVAGIPVTDWMLTAIDRGSKLADEWLHAKAATGELSHGMETAKDDLQLVAHLVGALIGVVVQLGGALHPVAQVAVKDLTDGLHALAGDIHSNEDEIRALVGGALHLLVIAVKIASGAIGVADKVTGGFTQTIEILAAIKLASVLSGWAGNLKTLSGGFVVAQTEAKGLYAWVNGLKALGPIIIPIALSFIPPNKKGQDALNKAGLGFLGHLPIVGHAEQQVARGGQAFHDWAFGAPNPTGKDIPSASQQMAHMTFEQWKVGNPHGTRAQFQLQQSIAAGYDPSKNPTVVKPDVAAASALDKAIKKLTDTGSPFGGDPAWTKNLGPKGTTPTGQNLISGPLLDAIQQAKDHAAQAQTKTGAAAWLHTELDALEAAKKQLTKELAGATGKQKKAIETELRSIDGQIASVNKQVTTNLHEQASAVKQSFQSKISTAKSNISSAMSTLKATLDAQLQAQLQAYIDGTLGPKFFQGTDAKTGAALQTPLEKKLAEMQAADTLGQLQDAIAQADSPEAAAAAQRQLDEYNLSIAAQKERQQADADYAAAVKQAQADSAERQRQLNLQLDTFAHGLDDGTTKIGDLAGIVADFGLSLTADDGVIGDFNSLQSSVKALGFVYEDEAVALAKLGSSTAAAVAALDALAAKLGGQYGAGAGDDALGRWLHNQGVPGFKDGGFMRTGDLPQLVLMHGDEEALFSGSGKTLRDIAGGVLGNGGGSLEEHIHFHGGTFIGASPQQVARDLKPYLDRVVGV